MALEAIGTVIGATLTGLTGLIVAWSGFRRSRDQQIREELDQCWEEQQRDRSRFLAALRHLGLLEELLVAHRVEVPPRPDILGPGSTDEPAGAWRPRPVAA